jgi:hypothetical protein
MLLTSFLAFVVILLALAVLSFIGRALLIRALMENEEKALLVRDFHQDLVAYADSSGQNGDAFQRLVMSSPAVESALGWDNIVHGVRVGVYLLNNAPLLPLAIQEMRREYGDGLWDRRGNEIADNVQTILFRHLGRRSQRLDRIQKQATSFGSCLAVGWSTLAALPITVLTAFGLLKRSKADKARNSLLFRLWNFLLALAAISGPLFAYLADRDKIDAAARSIFP